MNTDAPRLPSSDRLARLEGYAFDEIKKRVAALRDRGVEPVDFGVGDPTVPTPQIVRDRLKTAVDERACSGYPDYAGAPAYRAAAAAWMERRFGVALDPGTEICGTIGSKEAVFNVHEGILDPGDTLLVPTPGYPPYKRGCVFAEGVPYFYPLEAKNGFLPDLDAIPTDVADRARAIWVCYPNSPTGAVADKDFYARLMEKAERHDWIVLSDEAYSEIYYTPEPPPSLLEVARERCLVFFSLSKRSAMTGWRIGWVAGDERLVSHFRKVKTNIDSGTPTFIQDAAITALGDEAHVDAFRAQYREKRDMLVEAFTASGLEDCTPAAAMYVWQKAPDGWSGIDFAARLLEEDVAAVATPGEWISDVTAGGTNPGAGYARFALVPTVENTRRIADRIATLTW